MTAWMILCLLILVGLGSFVLGWLAAIAVIRQARIEAAQEHGPLTTEDPRDYITERVEDPTTHIVTTTRRRITRG